MLAIKVPKEQAEKVRADLSRKGILDSNRIAQSEGEYVLFPITKEIETEHEITKAKLEERYEPGFEELLEEELTPGELEHVRTSQDIIGDIAIIEIARELEDKEKQIAEALLKAKPYIKTVLKKGKHEGTYRTQKLELLAGEDKKETIHKENNVRLKLDVEKVYFSPRLAHDRETVSSKVKPGEKVLVLFAGCGPYTCVIAKNTQAQQVTGVEINPTAHQYAEKNIKLNKLKNTQAMLGDVGDVLPELGDYDRIVMAGPEHAEEHLDEAMKHAKNIHYYDFMDEEEIERKAEEAAKGHEYTWETAGQVSPGRFRVRVDIKL